MLSTSPAFVKYSPSYSARLRKLLAQAGFHGMSANSLIGAIAELGGPLFSGTTVRLTLAKVGALLYRSRAQVSRILKSLTQAGIISKVNKGRGGIELKLLETPDSVYTEELDSLTSISMSSNRDRAVAVRLKEIKEEQGGFRKGEDRARFFLRKNMSQSEIEAALAREKEREEKQVKERKEELEKNRRNLEQERKEKRVKEELRSMSPQDRERLEEEVSILLPQLLRHAAPTNSIRALELQKLCVSRLLSQNRY